MNTTWPDAAEATKVAQKIADCPKSAPAETTCLPGPTGESNRLTHSSRAPFLCIGPGQSTAEAQKDAVLAAGGRAVVVDRVVDPKLLSDIDGIAGAIWWGDADQARAYDQALAVRNGVILPLLTGQPDAGYVRGERRVCVETTAAGGNAALLGGAS